MLQRPIRQDPKNYFRSKEIASSLLYNNVTKSEGMDKTANLLTAFAVQPLQDSIPGKGSFRSRAFYPDRIRLIQNWVSRLAD